MARTSRIAILVGMLSGLGWSAAIADSVDGGKDHPLAGRFEGSRIVDSLVHAFDEVALLKAPIDYGALLDRNALDDRSGAEWLVVQGRLTEIRYEIPEGRSSLEVATNYQSSLAAAGFETLFACADRACLTGNLRDPYLLGQLIDARNGVSTAYFDHARYLLAKADRSGAPAYVAVIAGEDKGQTIAFVRVVEVKPIETGKIKLVTAGEMKQAMDKAGRVQIYGIQFDFDKATVRPESRPVLAEIAKLLTDTPSLKLRVVGHTDGKGTEAYNLDLSNRRATSVVAELVAAFNIDRARLDSQGAGMSQPLASNETEEGRAKNRRVELIAR